MVGTVVKPKIGDLEEELRAGSLRRVSNELTSVVQGGSGKNMLLSRFQDRYKIICL